MAKLKEYFDNKPKGEILNRIINFVLKIYKYNQLYVFNLTVLKFFLELNGKTKKKPTKTALAVFDGYNKKLGSSY